jgi:transcriptional regulator
MYIPASFKVTDQAVILSFVERFDFATLLTPLSSGDIHVTHLPLLLERGENGVILRGHVARANEHWRDFDGAIRSLAIFQGPHGYVSPSWYKTQPAVPTWNYATVHAHGSPRIIQSVDSTTSILRDLVRNHEGDRPNPWRMEELPEDFYRHMVSSIVAFEMPIDKLEAKFKLGQNRSSEDRQGVVNALSEEVSPDAKTLAEFMRQYAFTGPI